VAEVIWSERSASDLEAIHQFIARDSPAAADLTIERIRASTRRLAKFPDSGRTVPEAPEEHVKEVIVRPYRVIYRRQHTDVYVATVLHGARQLLPGELDV
jgi:plasmid stabilization system protein ParE